MVNEGSVPVWTNRPVRRREDRPLLTGASRFTGDIRPPETLHVAFTRSPVASAALRSVSLEAALSARGVVAAFAAADLELKDIPGQGGPGRPEAPFMTRPPLVHETIRHVGEAIAVVVAESPYDAVDGAELVDYDYDLADVVADVDAALADEVLLFPDAGSNVVTRRAMPDEDMIGAAAETLDWPGYPVEVDVTVENQRLAPAPIEPVAIVAEPTDDGGVTVWCGHQAPHRLRRQLSRLLDLDPEKVRVIVPAVGGAFGMKAMLFPEYVVVVALAVRLGTPISWVQTRYEQFICGTHGRAMRHRVRLGGDQSGRIRAGRVEILADVGAYPHNGSGVPLFAQYMAPGSYDFDDFGVNTTMVVTNRAPTGSYRGAGRPEATFAIERAVDVFASRAGLDPAEVRRMNAVRPEQMPYLSATGALYDGGDYVAALDLAIETARLDEVRAEQSARRQRGENPLGIGVALFVERAGGDAASAEYSRVEVQPDGRVTAFTGSSAAGQGHATAYSQIVASVLGVAPGLVEVVEGDTARVKDGTGSFASRSMQIGGSGLHRCAGRVADTAREAAARMLECSVDELKETDGGGFAAVADPSVEATLAEVAAWLHELGEPLADEENYSPGAQTFPYGACVAVVEVDQDTGKVTVVRLVSVDDCGRVVNPLLVEGQVHGSLLQGLAQAVFEGIEYDDQAQPLATSLADYPVPTAPDAPRYTTARMVTPAPSNPLGAKGAGESGCIGAPPAIVNAVVDALSPVGVEGLAMPLTPERVWRALNGL